MEVCICKYNAICTSQYGCGEVQKQLPHLSTEVKQLQCTAGKRYTD